MESHTPFDDIWQMHVSASNCSTVLAIEAHVLGHVTATETLYTKPLESNNVMTIVATIVAVNLV